MSGACPETERNGSDNTDMTEATHGTSSDARQLLTDHLRKYMVGPLFGPDERIQAGVWKEPSEGNEPRIKVNQRPSDFYHVGILHPLETPLDPEEDDVDQDTSDTEDMSPDSVMALANAMRQSAMGCTFRIADEGESLDMTVSCGIYELLLEESPASGGSKDGSEEAGDAQGSDWKSALWVRTALDWQGRFSPKELASDLQPKLLGNLRGLEILAMKHVDEDGVAVTVTLVNRESTRLGQKKDGAVYQAQITIRHLSHSGTFKPLTIGRNLGSEEYWNHELLYRKSKQFASGHGCSVSWQEAEDEMEAVSIRSEWIPEREVFKASSEVDGLQGSKLLNLESLDRSVYDKRDEVLEELHILPDVYQQWIESAWEKLDVILSEEQGERRRKLEEAGKYNLHMCETQLARIRKGIEFLEHDDHAWSAFTLANTAMRRSMEKERPGTTASWFPFQLAFQLLAIPSVAIEDHAERDILDLIWFPTGGGKTEAYLGLAAFAIFYRRLAFGGQGAGTAVLTRYTLRFLTSQQFERTASVVLACELVRRQVPALGSERIDIGLYVGGSVTPNWLRQAEDFLLNADTSGGSGVTTLPVGECPWCSADLDLTCQRVQSNRLETRCPSPECPFHDGLPLAFVDEEIFCNPPSLIVATIDKFALMPWRPEAGAIFGAGTGYRAPSLIIQDELHLINDSLGSLAGLYESAIDLICKRTSARSKIVGSTATIRRADEQTRALFDRRLLQFPPSGVDVRNSFFFREDQTQPGRLYLGVHAQGRSPKHTQPIVLGILLQFSKQIDDVRLRDPFHTLVVYFNSLRELGGAFVLVEDDVPRYLRALDKNDALPAGMGIRKLKSALEISGSVPSDMIKEYSKNLKTTIHSNDLNREPEDIVLATNMISVGVDVGRLGAMVVVGQPKTTSEYIQATSRIGRPSGSAGLVVTIYNWSRPRDRSHYENFCGYHQAFYRHVEAQSVTPFSARARDRALHAAVFSLARILIPELGDEDSPKAISEKAISDQVRELVIELMQRIRSVETDSDDVDAAEEELNELLEVWQELADDLDPMRPLVWTGWQKPGEHASAVFSRKMIGSALKEPEWEIQFSMRDVDSATPVVLKR